MSKINFEGLKQIVPNFHETFDIRQVDDKTYQRLVCYWQEPSQDNKIIGEKHVWMGCINVNNGEIFVDDGKNKIFVKHVVLLFYRPFVLFAKTLWHLSFAPVLMEIYKLSKEIIEFSSSKRDVINLRFIAACTFCYVIDMVWYLSVFMPILDYMLDFSGENSDCLSCDNDFEEIDDPQVVKRGQLSQQVSCEELDPYNQAHILSCIYNSTVDIVRTPIYALIIEIMHLYAIVMGLIDSNSLYHTRDMIGSLERNLLRVKKPVNKVMWQISPCFSPQYSMVDTYNQDFKKCKPIKKSGQAMSAEEFIKVFNEAKIKFAKHHVEQEMSE